MPLGEALYESGGRLQHVYFLTTSIVSLLYAMKKHASLLFVCTGNICRSTEHARTARPCPLSLIARFDLN